MFSESVRAAFLALTALAVSISATQSLSIKVQGSQAVDSVEDLKIVATITNTGDETLKVLNDPRGPLNNLPTDTFVITDAKGSQPLFTGIKLKYVLKTAAALEAYTTLVPGESVAVEHNLAHAYNFTVSGAASYDIYAKNTFYIVNADSTISTLHADAGSHSAKISGKLAVARSTLVKRATFNGCTTSQQSLLLAAAKDAQNYAGAAFSYASSHTSSTPRYTTWFGAYTAARHSTVVSHFSNIKDSDFSSYQFDCTCTESDVYAFVNPDEFKIVHLCGAFWNAPPTGTDSKGGTLVHESSHFTMNGATNDHVYGQSGCKSLAQSDPATAVDNADSHEYFAENNPALA